MLNRSVFNGWKELHYLFLACCLFATKCNIARVSFCLMPYLFVRVSQTLLVSSLVGFDIGWFETHV